MALVITLTCPICDLPMGQRTLTGRGTQSQIDGDFVKDPHQHVHYDTEGTPTCANGHRFRMRVEVLAMRMS